MKQSALSPLLKLEDKKDAQRLLIALIRPLIKYMDPAGSRFNLSGRGSTYSEEIRGMEAFCRPLWGLVPFWMGGGRQEEIERIYQRGLVSGTDPESPGFWGELSDSNQMFVEMAPIAFALIATPEILWDSLSDIQKENLASWLYKINYYKCPECNWVFFRIFVNTALKLRGKKYNSSILEKDKAFIETNYLGKGWYKDGKTGRVDYYSAFAMSFYSLLLSFFTGDCFEEEKKRAGLFLRDYILWFDEKGGAIPYGRSLTYRFAQSAFISCAVISHVDTVPLGILKGIINRNIRYFLEKDIFTSDGVLEVGYAYSNSIMGEKYNAPGSPYWALKTFLFLSLGDDDEYWKVKEEPFPVKNETRFMEEGKMIVHNRGFDSSLYTPAFYDMNNLGHFQEKYFKFVYSTAFPFSCLNSPDSLETMAPDSTLAIKGFDGIILTKYKAKAFEISETEIVIEWSPIIGINIKTTVTVTPLGHIRKESIENAYDIPLEAYETGFAMQSGLLFEKNGFISVKNREYTQTLKCLDGKGSGYLIKAYPNTNILYKNTVIPSICYSLNKGMNYFETEIRTEKNEQG